MAATEPGAVRLFCSFAMPVDAAAFSGVPSVTALKPLPKAKVLLAAAMDRRVVCCEPPAQAQQPAVPGKHLAWAHESWVYALDVHPDGARVATGGWDRRVKLWEWGKEQALADVKAHDDWVRAVAFSPDGRLLASAGDDGLVRLWDVATARPVATLDPSGGFLGTLAWSVDGKRLLAGGNAGQIYVWDVGQKKLERTIDIDNRRNIEDEPLNGGFSYPGGIRGLTCSPDGKRIAAVGLTSLHVLEMPTGKPVLTQAGRGFGVAFDPGGRWLAFSQEKDLVVWDVPAGRESRRIPVDQLGIFGICFVRGAGDLQLAAGSCNGRVGLWEFPA